MIATVVIYGLLWFSGTDDVGSGDADADMNDTASTDGDMSTCSGIKSIGGDNTDDEIVTDSSDDINSVSDDTINVEGTDDLRSKQC